MGVGILPTVCQFFTFVFLKAQHSVPYITTLKTTAFKNQGFKI